MLQSALLIIIVSDFTILKSTFHIIQDLKQASRKDPLTGLANRKVLWEKAAYLLEQSKRYNFKFALLYIDVDSFKTINDTYGHKAGDDLLIMIASRLSESVRSTDEVIIISRINEHGDGGKITEKILNKFFRIFKIGLYDLKIGASIGISVSKPDNKLTVDKLLSEADLAMYEIKRSGKNSFKFSN